MEAQARRLWQLEKQVPDACDGCGFEGVASECNLGCIFDTQ